MSEQNGQYPPLLDTSVLQRLRGEVDDEEGIWKVFVQNYINELPLRVERLRLALTTGDIEGAEDAVLSLQTSSEMIGAVRLAALTLEVQESIYHTEPENTGTVFPRLAAAQLRGIYRCAQQTMDHLQQFLP